MVGMSCSQVGDNYTKYHAKTILSSMIAVATMSFLHLSHFISRVCPKISAVSKHCS